MQPEFDYAWGKINPESFINTYGKSVYNEMRRQFGPGFFARKGEGRGLDVLANEFHLEQRGGYDAPVAEISESGFAEKVMAPHDQFEAGMRESAGQGYFQDKNNPRILYHSELADEPAATRNTPSKPWPENFPKVTQLTSVAKMQAHPDFHAAKAGDRDAAARLVLDMMGGKAQQEKLRALAEKYPDAILVAVHAEEQAGRNQIPRKLTDYISYVTGLEINSDIVQSGKVGRTGSDAWHRMSHRPTFDGPVEKGRKYILVDDVVTGGGTFSELRRYIELNGGEVVDMVSAGAAQFSTNIALSAKTRLALEGKFGVESLQQFLKEAGLYGGNHHALTESEARTLLGAGSLDAARDRIVAARQQGKPSAQLGVLSEARGEAPGEPSGQVSPPPSPTTLNQSPRGGIRQLDDGRYLVGLFKKADASTPVHEIGHFFLENLREAAELESAPQWVRDSWGKLQKEYGFDHTIQGEAWRPITERFAREFEAWAREGVAPSPELRGVFEQFKTWLTEIYKTVRPLLGKNGELSPEVRDVFDNLPAGEHELALQRATLVVRGNMLALWVFDFSVKKAVLTLRDVAETEEYARKLEAVEIPLGNSATGGDGQ